MRGHFGLIKQQLCLYFKLAFARRTAKLTQSLAAVRDSLLRNCRVNFLLCASRRRHKDFLFLPKTIYKNALRCTRWYFFPPLLLPAPGNLPTMSVIEATSALSLIAVLTCAAKLQMSLIGAQSGKVNFTLECGMNLVSASLWLMSAGH